MTEVERHSYDVVVIGAGGAGLRAVIEARERGLKVAVVSKSLFGKAHTVMAEGGCAARWATPTRRTIGRPTSATRCAVGSSSTTGDGRTARQRGARPRLGAGDLRCAVRPPP